MDFKPGSKMIRIFMLTNMKHYSEKKYENSKSTRGTQIVQINELEEVTLFEYICISPQEGFYKFCNLTLLFKVGLDCEQAKRYFGATHRARIIHK
jgi:hypothetical protein